MSTILKAVRALGDEARVRLLRLLVAEELSVAELQEILGMGQSRISMALTQLKQAGLVEMRRAGQKSLYRFTASAELQPLLADILARSSREIAVTEMDDAGLRLVLEKRKDKLRSYFDNLAGRFGRDYVPGRSWRALADLLLKLLPRLVIADLGAGEGTLSLLLAPRAERVIAVDSSGKMVEYGTAVAQRNQVLNLEYRLGDLEQLPIGDGEADLALMHQSLHHALHPQKAVDEAWRILRPGGRIAIADLLKHGQEQARELYADVWLGFSEVELAELLHKAGFEHVAVSTVNQEDQAPHFQTLLAIAEKAHGAAI